jgi:hypothetical protein
MNELTPAKNKIAAFDLMLAEIAAQYEHGTEEQRKTMSPFCKFFYEMAQDNEPVASGGAV